MDKITAEQRSRNMSRIKGKNTSIEVMVRKELFRRGYRFRKNDKRYPGHPDIVLPKYDTIIMVHGCFWHRHSGCRLATKPKINVDYWSKKFRYVLENDNKVRGALELLGWNVLEIWECDIRKDLNGVVDYIESELKRNAVQRL